MQTRLKDQNLSNATLEGELQDANRRKNDFERAWKEEKELMERQLNELKYNLSQLSMENESCIKKLGEITDNYNEA